jgi:hypothetical protein
MRLRSGVVVIVGSRFLAAGFHAHLILGLAGRAAIVLHARLLLIGADLAARLGMSRSKIRKHYDRCQQRCNSYLHKLALVPLVRVARSKPLPRSRLLGSPL